MNMEAKQYVAKVMSRWIHLSKFRRKIVKLAAPDFVTKLNEFEEWLNIK